MWRTVPLTPPHVTIVNIEPNRVVGPGINYIHGDGRDLHFANASFELAFSNSVIEHLDTLEDQKRFAGEMLRVGKRIYCQTPNKWFPVEPHVLALFIHWLPQETVYLFCPSLSRETLIKCAVNDLGAKREMR